MPCISQATLLLHVVLWLWDKLPLTCILVSAAAHVAYLRMLRTFPFFRVLSPDTAAAVGARRIHACKRNARPATAQLRMDSLHL